MGITSNAKEVSKWLGDLERKQIPQAFANTINITAFQARKALTAQMNKRLHKPTPFTQRAIRVKKATKRNLSAVVYVNEIQAEYLKFMYFGGIRMPKKKSIPVPTKAMRLNKYGNMPRKKIDRLLNDGKHFSGVVKGKGGTRRGIFKRLRGGKYVKQVIAWKDKAEHKKRIEFHKTVEGVVSNNFEKNFSKGLAFALKSARR
jgi:hypothetical protein